MATEIQVTVNPNPEVYTISVPGLQGIPGPKGDKGNTGDPNVLTIGAVTTGAEGSNASATITGATPNQILNFTIPRGNTGATGPANTLTVGTINTGAPGSSTVVTITGTAPNQILNLTIPRGDVGPANVLSIGTVTNASPGAAGTVTVTGTTPTQVLNFTLPLVRVNGTSTTSLAIATGSKVFTTQAGLGFVVGSYVRAASAANGTNYMAGNVTAYSGTSLTVNVVEIGGTGTLADWNISYSGLKGLTGNTGPAPVISTTSTTSITIDTGSFTFTTAAPMNLVVGQTVKAWATANVNNYMIGQITAISGTSLTINVTEANGRFTVVSAWTIALGSYKGGGVPTGGTTGNILYKASGTDFDTTWVGSSVAAAGNTFVLRDGAGNGDFNHVTVQTQTPSLFNELTSKQYVDGEVAKRLGPKQNATVALTANTEYLGKWEIQDDGTDSANWPSRMEFYYKPSGGTAKLTSYFNEYGEFRGISGKANTVPFRLFTKLQPADAAHTVNMLEIQDDRTTRTNLFKVDSAGRAYTAATTPSWPDELTRKDYVDAGDKRPLIQLRTGGTSNAQVGYWFKIADVSVTALYGDIVLSTLLRAHASGTNNTNGARVTWRVKQQAAFGSQPFVSVNVTELLNGAGLTVSDFAVVVTSVAGPTTAQLYVRNPETYSEMNVFEEAYVGNNNTLVYAATGVAGVAALPAGTSYFGVAVGAAAAQSNVLVLATGAVIPAGTKADTVIIRK